MIKGITVKLHKRIENGVDDFGHPVSSDEIIEVENVLVAPATSDDLVTQTDLAGKKAIYTLAILKGDTNDWEDAKVEFFGKIWHTFGFATEGIEENIPLKWNKKVMVERYE